MTRLTIQARLRRFHNFAKGEPLVHFLVLGLALFAFFGLVNGSSTDNLDKHIVVDQDHLLAFVQSRQVNLDDATNPRIGGMAPTELQALVEEYIREETMYREASSLGLDKDDYLIRRRLVQSLEFLFRSMGEIEEPSEKEFHSFYTENRARYTSPASITFSHIYFSSDSHGWDGAERLARKMMTNIQINGEDAVLASGWPGDRFAYHLNYAERDRSIVASHFGQNMAKQLFLLRTAPGEWQGPFRSTSGFHLIRIERLAQNEQLPYQAVAGQVRSDLIEARKDSAAAIAYDRLRAQYDVQIDSKISQLMTHEAGKK